VYAFIVKGIVDVSRTDRLLLSIFSSYGFFIFDYVPH